jgi:hypothetical protein
MRDTMRDTVSAGPPRTCARCWARRMLEVRHSERDTMRDTVRETQ